MLVNKFLSECLFVLNRADIFPQSILQASGDLAFEIDSSDNESDSFSDGTSSSNI